MFFCFVLFCFVGFGFFVNHCWRGQNGLYSKEYCRKSPGHKDEGKVSDERPEEDLVAVEEVEMVVLDAVAVEVNDFVAFVAVKVGRDEDAEEEPSHKKTSEAWGKNTEFCAG